jgi:diketogulonate reductase-like aldo/keto reductase
MQPNKVEHFMKLSLKALNMEYVDLYLVHSPVGFVYVSDNELVPKGADGSVLIDNSTDLLAIWKEMEAQVDAGRAKAIGVSNFTPAQIERVVKLARIQPANHQVRSKVCIQSLIYSLLV